MKNLQDILDEAISSFAAINIENPKLNAELIFSHILQLKRTELYLDLNREISESQQIKIEDIVSRRLKHEPLQYIFGETEFYGLKFLVNKNVLIPRPETELLVEKIFQNEPNTNSFLDIGTGSGCIAITLNYLFPEAEVTAIDISKQALEIAKQNAVLNKVKVNFRKSDLFENVNSKFDIIVSNPPYIPRIEYNDLPDEIQHYEPENALLAKEEGLYFYKIILNQAKEYLTKKGKIYFEIGYGQADRITNLALGNGFSKVEIFQDLNGFDRIMKIDL
jgi:release factor glutamine methyltransferase